MSKNTNIQNPNCPECGGAMVRDTRPYTVKYKGLTAVVNTPGWYCGNCDEAVFVGKDMDAADRALVKLKAQAENLLQPEEVKRIRKKLALTQVEAGELLGGGPNAFQKYESAQITTSKALTVLLEILREEPRLLERVRGRVVKYGDHENGA